MKDTALYEHLLGLKAPWSVKKVDLSLAEQRVVVEVALKKGQLKTDTTAGNATAVTPDTAAIQTALAQLKTDRQAFETAVQNFLSTDRANLQAAKAAYKADVVAVMNSATLTADEAKVQTVEAKLKADKLAGNTAPWLLTRQHWMRHVRWKKLTGQQPCLHQLQQLQTRLRSQRPYKPQVCQADLVATMMALMREARLKATHRFQMALPLEQMVGHREEPLAGNPQAIPVVTQAVIIKTGEWLKAAKSPSELFVRLDKNVPADESVPLYIGPTA